MSPEDTDMFLRQFVCSKCYNRFTTAEDAQLHHAFIHDKEPKPSELMEVLEQILITVSRTEDNGGELSNRSPRPKPPIA